VSAISTPSLGTDTATHGFNETGWCWWMWSGDDREWGAQEHRSGHARFITGATSVSPVLALHLGYSWMKNREAGSPRKEAGLSDVTHWGSLRWRHRYHQRWYWSGISSGITRAWSRLYPPYPPSPHPWTTSSKVVGDLGRNRSGSHPGCCLAGWHVACLNGRALLHDHRLRQVQPHALCHGCRLEA